MSRAETVCPSSLRMPYAHTSASTKAHTPMNMSMKTLTVVVVISIQPSCQATPPAAALARTSASVMAPLAIAAPSVLTASPIHAPATSGWCARKACAAKGRTTSSTTAKSTTSDETMTATTGQEVADREPRRERDDVARLAGQRERPPDAEPPALVRCGGDVGVVAREPAEPARPQDHAEAGGEALRVEAEARRAGRHDGEEEEIGEGEARDTGERGVRFRDRCQRLRGGEPHLRRHAPAEELGAGQGEERERKHQEADPEGPPVVGRLHDRIPRRRRVDAGGL